MENEDIITQEENNIEEKTTKETTPEKENKKEKEEEQLLLEVDEEYVEEKKSTGGLDTLSKILGGDILYAKQLRKQIKLILLIFVFVIIYISNRYRCQQYQIQIDKLTKEVKDARYKALSLSSELTEISRESRIEELVKEYGDSTLRKTKQPPYIINVSEK